uniref:hypothetical protein n=1 Tax=Acetatifactor sp. TaxID=1872090 RepID=UPI004056C71C
MTGITLEKGTIVYESGKPMTALHLITSGKITVTYPGGTYQLGKGDVIGICEICSEIHFLQYTVAENATILTYNFSSIDVLDNILKNHFDIARLFILSACFQINTLLQQCSISEMNCASFHQILLEDYEKYTVLCNRYRIQSRNLNDWEELTAYLGEEAPDLWLSSYYLGLAHIYSGENYKTCVAEPGVSSGLLRKCSLDFRRAYIVLDEQYRYLQQIAGFYFHTSGNDLFDFYTSMYYKLGTSCSDTNTLLTDINRFILSYKDICEVDLGMLNRRIESFEYQNSRMQAPSSDDLGSEENMETMETLTNSLNTILDFSCADMDISDSFRQNIHNYKLLPDKFGTDAESCRIRAELTREFYTLYSLVFEKSLEAPQVPAPVKMFLYFGYVDEELAGRNNSLRLYKLLDTMGDYSDHGVYTFYDWLIAIYQGKKEPSRNEFDQDYADYIHKQKISNNITDLEFKQLENNAMAKVNYELSNMFPSVNKVTYGRISIFCPVFCAENVLKDLEDSYVTVSKVAKAIEQVKKIDYTLFYRESLDMDNINALGKEMLHFEYLPDIILTPNVGIRGIMWQEIEGKRRNSSSRMLFSIFHLEDINLTMIRLAGEFRWELCKRIQGGRWNDIGELSLTSEYFDYVQFYKKNHDLSPEAKEKVRTSLQRAKNSFKEMFVRDYIIWIMFEGIGAPRMNKVARKILFTYCPFPKELRETLKQNPLYTDILTYYDLKTAQRMHHLNMLIKKLRNSGVRVPESLEQELLYAEGTLTS